MIDIISPYKTKKIEFQCNNGEYIYRRELIDDSEYGGNGGLKMINCYSSFTGEWIGDNKQAAMLCCKHNLSKLQKISKSSGGGCQIGFSKRKQKWYGWSHRAFYGFGIGSECKKGDCSYIPNNIDELYLSVTKEDEDGYAWMKEEDVKKTENGIMLRHKMYKTGDPDEKGVYNPPFEEAEPDFQTILVGKGEWIAKTLEDAKQMAIDFANGVS